MAKGTPATLALEKAGAAVHLPQRDLTTESLDAILRSLLNDRSRLSALREHALARARPNAAVEIAGFLLAMLEGRDAR